jgi:hypothetical protein
MDEAAARAARGAARRLAGELGGQLPGDVEAALRARAHAPAREQYLDPISLASLVVSVAGLAWGIYRDLRGKGGAPQGEVVERRVRVEVRELDAGTAPEQRDRIIEVVVDELMSPTDGPD